MGHVTFSEFRQNMAHYLDRVSRDREPLVITRSAKPGVVVLSEAEFAGWQATVHLLISPRNAEHLLRSLEDARAGRTFERELLVAPEKA